MTEPVIELRGVSRRYWSGDRETYALHSVDLDIHAGEMVALMGASGSGKSTLLNILGCLDRPSSGSYLVGGRDAASLDPTQLASLRREQFGFIFQRYNLLPQLSALANVEVPAVYAGESEATRRLRARELLTRMGLGERLEHRPNQLSGGQQQRVSIARALMNGGAIILADEPTGALDSKTGREVMELLLVLNRMGHTLIVATHDPHIAGYAERIIEINDGCVVSDHATQAQSPTSTQALGEEMDAPTAPGAAVREIVATGAASWSRLVEGARMAWFALLAHRLRTGLTLLGVVIGIVSVVMMVAVGEAAQRVIREAFKGAPANFLMIGPGKDFGDPDAARIQTLAVADADILRQQSFARSVSPMVTASTSLRIGSMNALTTVNGVHETHFDTMGLAFDIGSSFSHDDTVRQSQLVLVDEKVRRKFFGADNPMGRIIYIGKLPCVIIGVVARNAAMEAPGQDERLNVWLPYTTVAARLVGRSHLDNIAMQFRDGLTLGAAERGVQEILLRRHHIKDFVIFNLEEHMRSNRVLFDSVTLLLGVVGVVSLVVGGIGVMNIMLVSVSERAREIGIRMAVGARRLDIQSQFLIEAVVVCSIGGAAGVLISYGIAAVANDFLPEEWQVSLSVSALGVAVACSTLTGVVFGFVPARNASRLDPVEALSRD
jgi:macrolide transport system ATP-binding/permease protein